jgi:(R)-2-hydroxyacyl-CoA dehydratese activating ATPase
MKGGQCEMGKSGIVAGVDIGAATAKTVIISNGTILSGVVIPTGHSIKTAAEEVTRKALEKAGLWRDDFKFDTDFDYVVSTGYGRNGVSFSRKALTEIMCHGKGAHYSIPEARTIIDIGGQDSKVIGLDDMGLVNEFVMNDKCAAGTGRFFEVMSEVLEIPIEEFGPEALKSQNPCHVSSTCTIFAESEIVSHRAEGRKREDLLAGIAKAVASRVVVMGKSVGFRKAIIFTGGVAKNVGVKRALENEIGMEIIVPEEPQIMGALGAAIIAKAEAAKLAS